LGLIALALGFTWHAVYRRYLRRFNLALCLTVMASEAVIGIYGGDAITFVVTAILVLAGTAALVHWVLGGKSRRPTDALTELRVN
jgi:hypothetical protein